MFVANCWKYCAVRVAGMLVSPHVHLCDLAHILFSGMRKGPWTQAAAFVKSDKVLRTQPARD